MTVIVMQRIPSVSVKVLLMTLMTAMTMICRGSLKGSDSRYVSLLLPIIMGPTILSIYRPGRGEPADRTLVDGPWALPLR